MKKRTIKVFGKVSYLLGKGKDGKFYYLTAPQFECGWYWSIGSVVSYTNNARPEMSRDIDSWESFKYAFFQEHDGHTNFKERFVETPLSDKEIWQLMELMKSACILEDMAEMCYIGGAHYTESPCKETLHDTDEYKRIIDVKLPAIFNAVGEILHGPQGVKHYGDE